MLDCYRDLRYIGLTKTFVLLLLTTCLFNARAVSFPDGPEVGQVAPTLKLSTWLQAPSEAALGWPAGKVVVLEFWATICNPCVASIPHLNELANQFKDKPVQFIAVTDDKESMIKQFLHKTPINAWIGVGSDAGIGENTPYRVYAIPHTVMIDAHGRIALITDPRDLNATMIQACLDGLLSTPAGGQTAATDKAPTAIQYWTSDGGTIPGLIPGQFRMGIKPLYQVMVQHTPTNSTLSSRPVECWSRQAMTLQNEELNRAIQIAFDVKPARIVVETELPKEKYDFYITLQPVKDHHKNRDRFEAVFAQAVAVTFGLTVKRETRDIDLLVLKTNATTLERLSQSTNSSGEYTADSGEAAATDKPLSALAEELEIVAAKPVLDETGLTNHCSFDIKWEQKDFFHPNLVGITAAVNKLGLDLVPVKKSLEVIVVCKAP